jgi:hypothetical protein
MLSYITNYINHLFSEKRFYYLSLKRNKSNQFSIHGLWPQTDLNTHPVFCQKVNFSITPLSPIINDLQKYWYSDIGDNDDFWKHEYEKHGSCMFNPMSEFEYFDKTLELYHEAINKNLPSNYEKENKCLIPVSIDFKFITDNHIQLDTIDQLEEDSKIQQVKSKNTDDKLYPIIPTIKFKELETIDEDENESNYYLQPIPNLDNNRIEET